MTKTKY